jgi:uncharacterized protein YggU (UPF0235/DUF167 family)
MDVPIARLRLRVAPAAGRPGVVGRHGLVWKLRVAAAPAGGAANRAVIALLAETLGLARPHVRLVAGGGSRDKVVDIAGLASGEAERRLAAASREELG